MRYVVVYGEQVYPAPTRAQAYEMAKTFSLYSDKKVSVKDLTKVSAGSRVKS
jgi:hypothetical protein